MWAQFAMLGVTSVSIATPTDCQVLPTFPTSNIHNQFSEDGMIHSRKQSYKHVQETTTRSHSNETRSPYDLDATC